MDMTAVSSF